MDSCRSYFSQPMLQGLTWLARTFERLTLTEIQVAEIQPTWLETIAQRRLYRLWISVCGGLCFGLIVGLIGGLSFGLVRDMQQGVISGLLGGTVGGLLSGIGVGFVSCSIDGLNFGPFGDLDVIRPLPIFCVSWGYLYRVIWRKLLRRLIVGFLIGLCLGLSKQPITLLVFAVLGAVTFGVLESLLISRTAQHPERLGKSHKSIPTLIVVLMAAVCGIGLWSLLLLGLEQAIPWRVLPLIGPPIGLYFWFCSSGIIYLKRLIVRIILWHSGAMPWNLTKFLNQATALGLLRRNGVGYSFSNSSVQDCFVKAYFPGMLT